MAHPRKINHHMIRPGRLREKKTTTRSSPGRPAEKTPHDPSQAGRRGSKRARVSAEVAFDAAGPIARAGASTSDRPTPAELQEALDVIQQMKKLEPPLISRRGQPPKPNIVACALALQRGERFSDDREALRRPRPGFFGASIGKRRPSMTSREAKLRQNDRAPPIGQRRGGRRRRR